ncbi:zinc finger protein 845 isoform X2 [Xenopus laevis]|uniref:C2H2-type domain-containing protein n=2 Tax=Xenopus laevis TaxID=8355 RepID=A0A974CF41_XENLA|nr:zinc finger protein 845 isoform X2 [Xenopus laevis]OCT72130.1 hypothetical protein XELAEV_18035096mg [Xenopus laevis]
MRATRYRATSNLCADPEAISLVSVSLASLHHLVLLCHHHGRSCASPLSLLSNFSFTETKNKIQFLWGCGANHQFHWDPLECSTEMEGCATLKEHSESTVRQLCDNEQETLLCNTGILSNNLTMQEKCNLIVEVSESFNTQSTYVKGSSQHTDVCSDIGCPKNAEKDIQMPDTSWKPSETYHRKEGSTPAELTGELRQQKISVENQQLSPLAENTLDHTGKRDMIQVKDSHMKMVRCKFKALTTCLGGNLGADGKQQGTSLSSSKKKNKDCSTGKCRNICSPHGKTIPLTEKEKERQAEGYNRDHEIEFTTIEKSHYVETSRDICEILSDSLARDQKDEIVAEVAKMNNCSNEGEHGLNKHQPEDGNVQNQTSNRHKPFVDEELAEICKKRIRKSTPSELFLCEVDNCGKVFSKRQYLNYHQKYQHVNQRTFCCPVPECGRKFNFKKHLKEHEKRHSNRRDFICEFCARAFRSSSNLIIHHRIHTGEKPLQSNFKVANALQMVLLLHTRLLLPAQLPTHFLLRRDSADTLSRLPSSVPAILLLQKRCEFCGFTCRQKASLNWHMKKHDADTFYQFPCNICGQRFEKRDNLAAHRSRKHLAPPESASVENSAKVNEQEKSSCCKTLTPENFSTNAEATADTTQGVKESTFNRCQDLTDNTNDRLQENAQVSGHVQSEISLVIIL